MLERAMAGVQAWERLNDYGYSGRLTMGGLRDLMLRAGYPVGVADEVAKQRGWDRLQAGEVM